MKVAPLLYLLFLCPCISVANSTKTDSLTTSITATGDLHAKENLLILRSKACSASGNCKPGTAGNLMLQSLKQQIA